MSRQVWELTSTPKARSSTTKNPSQTRRQAGWSKEGRSELKTGRSGRRTMSSSLRWRISSTTWTWSNVPSTPSKSSACSRKRKDKVASNWPSKKLWRVLQAIRKTLMLNRLKKVCKPLKKLAKVNFKLSLLPEFHLREISSRMILSCFLIEKQLKKEESSKPIGQAFHLSNPLLTSRLRGRLKALSPVVKSQRFLSRKEIQSRLKSLLLLKTITAPPIIQ